MQRKFNVTGMTCSACSANVEKSVKKLNGVKEVNVNLLSGVMNVSWEEDVTNKDAIEKAVIDSGYGIAKDNVSAGRAEKQNDNAELNEMKQRVAISFVFLVPLMYISMFHMIKNGALVPEFIHSALYGNENVIIFAFTQFLLTLPILYVNRKYFFVGFKTLAKASPNMDSLIAIGSSAAVFYGIFVLYRLGYGVGHSDTILIQKYGMDIYFESAATILTLISLGKYLETKSKSKTNEAITKLIRLAPETAIVIKDGKEVEVPVSDIKKDDIIVIKSGDKIPVDGVIIEGSASIDQSAITGESIPVEKLVNDKVISATINKSGFIKIKAEKVGSDTTLSQIIRLVEEAANSKAPISKLADRISGIFVPIVILISILSVVIWLVLGASFEFALSIGIAVLVISCPCALGLATPVAIMVGTGVAAENSILIKSAQALELLHKVQVVVLDKTGTITEGKPKVTDVLPLNELSKEDFLILAASLEIKSEHPLSLAIVEKAKNLNQNLEIKNVTNFKTIAGKGISGEIENKKYYAGNMGFMKENSIDVSCLREDFSKDGKTPMYFACENDIMGIIAVADTINPKSYSAISQLSKMKLDVVMLTGDNEKTAMAVQKKIGIGKVIAEVLPAGKEEEIRKLQQQGKIVAMVGDGINDAPALTRADVGIAIGAGTDIAIESADVVLIKNDLTSVVAAIELSRAVIKNIKQNLFWAFFYNSIGIPIAAGLLYSYLGIKLNPMLAALAMSLSSVSVVTNALRLKFFKPTYHESDSLEEINYIDENGDDKMKKIVKIEGMSCNHCKATVEKVLSNLEGISSASVDLNKKCAVVKLEKEVDDEALLSAVNEAGFQAISVEGRVD